MSFNEMPPGRQWPVLPQHAQGCTRPSWQGPEPAAIPPSPFHRITFCSLLPSLATWAALFLFAHCRLASLLPLSRAQLILCMPSLPLTHMQMKVRARRKRARALRMRRTWTRWPRGCCRAGRARPPQAHRWVGYWNYDECRRRMGLLPSRTCSPTLVA